jgi:hypothetical protein
MQISNRTSAITSNRKLAIHMVVMATTKLSRKFSPFQ